MTIDQLLRMTSGLALHEGVGPGAPQQMWFVELDTAAFAESAPLSEPPGTAWAYSNRGYAIFSRIVRDAITGDPHAVLNFSRGELFLPLGMPHVTIQFDAAGTPMGSNAMFATSCDWARFGLLYLNDGIVGGRRILPERWVAYSIPAMARSSGSIPPARQYPCGGGVPGAPRDAFMARGYLDQYVIVVPSENLVVVRFGASHGPGVLSLGWARSRTMSYMHCMAVPRHVDAASQLDSPDHHCRGNDRDPAWESPRASEIARLQAGVPYRSSMARGGQRTQQHPADHWCR